MNYDTQRRFEKEAEMYFETIPDPIKRSEIERMYVAFRSRLIAELRIQGDSNEGVVYGHLEIR